jgi:hypothetical protein
VRLAPLGNGMLAVSDRLDPEVVPTWLAQSTR